MISLTKRVLLMLILIFCMFIISHFDDVLFRIQTSSANEDVFFTKVISLAGHNLKVHKNLHAFHDKAEWMETLVAVNSTDIYGDRDCIVPIDKHSALRELLNAWMFLANVLNVSYCLTHGTLLGAYRNGQIVPYDIDLDVLVNHADVPKLQSIVENSFSNYDGRIHLTMQREYLKPVDKRRRYRCRGKTVPLMIDECSFVEPLGRLVKNSRHVDLVGFIVKNRTVTIVSEDLLKDYHIGDIFPFKRCIFMGMETYCPQKPKEVLQKQYKDLKPVKICKKGVWV